MSDFRIFPSNEQKYFIPINSLPSEIHLCCVSGIGTELIICYLKFDWDKHNGSYEKEKFVTVMMKSMA